MLVCHSLLAISASTKKWYEENETSISSTEDNASGKSNEKMGTAKKGAAKEQPARSKARKRVRNRGSRRERKKKMRMRRKLELIFSANQSRENNSAMGQ
jgi:hypothetical protein